MKLERHLENPILTPDPGSSWESGAVFNPGAALGPGGLVYLLYRAIPAGYAPFPDRPGYTNYISSIGCAVSRDGRRFERRSQPVLTPDTEADRYGCEDARANPLTMDGQTTYLLTYTALRQPAWSGRGDGVGLAQTSDFLSFRKHGVIGPAAPDKDVVIFPEPLGGKIVMLHRIPPDIQMATFESLEHLLNPDPDYWERHLRDLDAHTLMRPRFPWEASKIGAGCPPIKTDEGWLLIYHGRDATDVYRAGVALLDLEAPARVLARSPTPILEPEADYERVGDIPNVVFPQGAVVRDGTLHIYYGAADEVCALATAPLDDLLTFLRAHRL